MTALAAVHHIIETLRWATASACRLKKFISNPDRLLRLRQLAIAMLQVLNEQVGAHRKE